MPRNPKQNTHDARMKRCYEIVKHIAELDGVNTNQRPMAYFDKWLDDFEEAVRMGLIQWG